MDILAIIVVAAWLVLGILVYIFIKQHMLGSFKYDNSGEIYRCLLEFDRDLDIIEQYSFAIVRIKEADLSLPGERKSHN